MRTKEGVEPAEHESKQSRVEYNLLFRGSDPVGGQMAGEWVNDQNFRFSKWSLRRNMSDREIKKIAEHFGFAENLLTMLKTRGMRLDQTYHLMVEIDFGDNSAKQPTTTFPKDARNAFDKDGVPLYQFGEPTEGPLVPKPANPLEFDIKLDLDKTPREILVKATPGGPTDEKKTANPLDREIALLRAQLKTALSGQNEAHTTELAKAKNDRENERIALVRVLENALKNPGFLKGDLVTNVAEIVRKLRAGEKIE